MNIRNLYLEGEEKRTFMLHLLYSIIEGVIAGVLILNEFVFIKSLKGSSLQLGFLFQFSVIVLLLSIFFNEFLKRVNKKKTLRITAIITRFPLLLLIFFPRDAATLDTSGYYHIVFLAVFLIYYLANPLIFPVINLFLKNTYTHENFGKLYSYATTVNKIVMMMATLLFGLLLDYNNYFFVYIYPLIGILGMISIYILTKIKFEEGPGLHIYKPLWVSAKESMLRMVKNIRINKPFLHFQVGFMFYGFAFMSSVTVITLFYEKELHLTYSSVAFYKNSYNVLAIVLLPFFGKLLTRIDPRKFALINFVAMCLFIFSLILTDIFPWMTEIMGIQVYYMMIFFIIFHGIFAAMMALTWYIGSAYFCRKEEAGDYQSIHLFLTGVRAVFSPLLGVLIYELFGFIITFIIAIMSLLAGIVIMYWSYKTDRIYHKESL